MGAPNLPSFFKSRRPREFSYRPWFYDAEKEARAQRNRIIRGEAKESDREVRMNFRSGTKDNWKQSRTVSQQRSRSNIRLILIIGLLCWIAYYLLR